MGRSLIRAVIRALIREDSPARPGEIRGLKMLATGSVTDQPTLSASAKPIIEAQVPALLNTRLHQGTRKSALISSMLSGVAGSSSDC